MLWKLKPIRTSKHPDYVPKNRTEGCILKNETTNKPHINNINNIKSLLKQMLKAKVFFLITCTSLSLSVIWLHFVTTQNQIVKDIAVKEAIQNVAQDSRLAEIYRKTDKLPKGLKFMLLWTQQNFAPFYFFRKGQEAFIRNNCSAINCYVTSDRNFFGGDLTKFDAIAFNGRCLRPNDLPKRRTPWQKYIFFNMESAENHPVCHPKFDNFFNWTATYKLDSDIPFTYLLIRRNGQIVGPSVSMNWPAEFPVSSENLGERLFNKSKAVAWFVSHCRTKSKRENVVWKLRKALSPYGYSIDVYGACGPLKCPRSKKACDEKLEKDYYFYLSLENSIAEDYVTEKLLTALQHDVVPIVYGGADYSRFLPPKSYLDAMEASAPILAKTIDRLISSPSLYAQHFRWKKVYQYSNPQTRENVCKVCAALNDKEMYRKKSVYENFRKWWLPKFRRQC